MTDLIKEWLRSGEFIAIEGIDLLPLPFTEWPDTPCVFKSKRAEVYHLKDLNDQLWVIKKFLTNEAAATQYRNSIKSLIPHRPGFEAGYLRKVLNPASLSNPVLANARLSAWINNAILMPAAHGLPWHVLACDIRDGRQYLPKKQRIRLVRHLSEKIKWLESQDIAHRALSSTNTYVDVSDAEVYLIDWDAIFHPTLPMPEHLRHGDPGYIAPFVKVRGAADAQNTWRVCADRFSLAVLNAEILSIANGVPLTGGEAICDQDEIYNRCGPCLTAIKDGLKAQFPKAFCLFEQTLAATSFDDCPAPADWLSAMGGESVIKPEPIPLKDRPALVRFNRANLVRLDNTAFARLKRHFFEKPPRR
jgi:serine/threonine protein kinase